MKKTISANINQTVFTLEEDGYELLKSYLDSISRHFSKKDDAEIVSDIEARISERLLETKKKVIQMQDIEPIITSMGTIKDLVDEDAVEPDSDPVPTPKKLFRDPDHAIIAGVSAGLANYFGTDPALIRLLFIVSLFFGGTGIIIYLALLIAMPEAKTPTDKMLMYGEPITIKNIETSIKKNFDDKNGQESTLTKLLLFPFRIVGAFFRSVSGIAPLLVRLILAVVGLSLLVGGVSSLAALGSLVSIILTKAYIPYVEYPVTEIMALINDPLILGSGLLAAGIPIFVLLILGGIAAITRKNPLSIFGVLVLMVLWISSIAIFSVKSVAVSPQIETYARTLVTIDESNVQTIPAAADLTKFDISGVRQVSLTQAATPRITITGDPEFIDTLDIATDSGTLFVRPRSKTGIVCLSCHEPRPVHVSIAVPNPDDIIVTNIRELSVSDVTAPQFSGTVDRHIRASFLDMAVQNLTLNLHYRAGVDLTGTGNQAVFNLDSSSRLTASGFKVRSATVSAGNHSRLSLNVTQALELTKADEAEVNLVTNPSLKINETASPSGQLD